MFLFLGSQVVVSPALFCWFAGPSAAMRFSGSLARFWRCCGVAPGRLFARRLRAPRHGQSGSPCCLGAAPEHGPARVRFLNVAPDVPGTGPLRKQRPPRSRRRMSLRVSHRSGPHPATPARTRSRWYVSFARPPLDGQALEAPPGALPCGTGPTRTTGFIQAPSNTGASLGPALAGSAAANWPAVKNHDRSQH